MLGDQKRLVQIVTNLLNNAAKYTPQGGTIQIRLTVQADVLALSVRGRRHRHAGRVAAAGLRAVHPGRQDIRSHPGRSGNRSGPGEEPHRAPRRDHQLLQRRGGRRAVNSPCCCRAITSRRNAGARQRLDTLAQVVRSKRPLRILVVDDNADAAQMLAMYLETLGSPGVDRILFARCDRLRETGKPDVCVLDIGLPDMDGYELARQLRAADETGHAFLIAVTGYGQEQDKHNAIAAGFDRHLVKPVDVGELAGLAGPASRLTAWTCSLTGRRRRRSPLATPTQTGGSPRATASIPREAGRAA